MLAFRCVLVITIPWCHPPCKILGTFMFKKYILRRVENVSIIWGEVLMGDNFKPLGALFRIITILLISQITGKPMFFQFFVVSEQGSLYFC